MKQSARSAADTTRLATLLRQVSRANIERDVRHLSTAYPNRNTLGKYLAPCADWLAGRLRECGLRDVTIPEYTVPSGKATARNVIGTKRGKTADTILLCAHFDSRQQRLFDPDAPAPGANDNGTGVAVVLEVARLLTPLTLGASLRFCFFSGEEQGLWGSRAYARQVKVERTPIRFVFNLDQIGFPPTDRALFVDRDEGGESRSNDAAGRALVARIQALARDIVKVPTRVDPAEDTDYVPFEREGYVIAGLYEAGKYPAYHRDTDTAEKVDYAYVADMARLTLATLYTEAT